MEKFSYINLVEEHEEAYFIWKKHKFLKKTIVHIDAHLDVFPDVSNNINLGNFLYKAIKENIVSTLWWVVPDNDQVFIKNLSVYKRHIEMLQTFDVDNRKYQCTTPLFLDRGIIKMCLYDITLFICNLNNLPKLDRSILLDIDVDFFIYKNGVRTSNLDNIGEKKQWLSIKKFIDVLQKKITKIECGTIAYSVRSGYTPLSYKSIGDKIAKKLGSIDGDIANRVKAGTYFKKFRYFFDKNDIKSARKYYFFATKLNPLYNSPQNNYGLLFLKKKNLNKAKEEFTKMLLINAHDIHSLIGLGIIDLYYKKYRSARYTFLLALKQEKDSITILLYLAWTCFALKDYKGSKEILLSIEKRDKYNFFSKYLLSLLMREERKQRKSAKLLQDAMSLTQIRNIPLGIESILGIYI